MLLRSEPLNFSNNEIALFGFVAIVGVLLAPTIGMTIFFLGGAFGSWIGSYTYYKFNSEVALLTGTALLVHLIKNNTINLLS